MNFFSKKSKEDNRQQTSNARRPEGKSTDNGVSQTTDNGLEAVGTVPGADDLGINFNMEELSSSIHSKRNPRILNSTQLQRVKDAKKLAETKLVGLEESLSRLQAQLAWLRRFNETKMALDREKKHLFELGKQSAMMAKESSMLERYDLFEGIHGTYQKIKVLREQIGQEKRGLSLLAHQFGYASFHSGSVFQLQLRSLCANQSSFIDCHIPGSLRLI